MTADSRPGVGVAVVDAMTVGRSSLASIGGHPSDGFAVGRQAADWPYHHSPSHRTSYGDLAAEYRRALRIGRIVRRRRLRLALVRGPHLLSDGHPRSLPAAGASRDGEQAADV